MIAFLFAFLAGRALCAVPATPTVLDREISAMGTRLTIRVEADGRGAALEASDRAIHAVQAAEARLSTWRRDSELSRVNEAKPGKPVALSPQLERDLKDAFSCSKATSGCFDPAIGPLVAAWGLRSSGKVPNESELKEALVDSDPGLFELDSGKIVKKKPQAAIEEGAFGKGVGLDDAASELKAAKVSSATLNFGGQVMLLGNQETEVAIADPESRGRVL